MTRQQLLENFEEQGRIIEKFTAFSVMVLQKYILESMPEDKDQWEAADIILTRETESLMNLCQFTNEEKLWVMQMYNELSTVNPDTKEEEATAWISTKRNSPAILTPSPTLLVPNNPDPWNRKIFPKGRGSVG